MDRSKLDDAAREIVDYTAKHPELQKAHTFVYDYPVFDNFRTLGKPEFVVMGINPGETEPDREERKRWEAQGRVWITRPSTWNGARSYTRSAKVWADNCKYYTNSERVVSTEVFFWSATDGSEFNQRFGMLWKSPHLGFCVRMNRVLLDAYSPRAVIIPGIGLAEKIRAEFKLTLIDSKVDSRNGNNLIKHYRDRNSGLPWIFTKHWTGSFGLSEEQRMAMRTYIQGVLNEPAH